MNNTKLDLRRIVSGEEGCIGLAQGKKQRRLLFNTVINLLVQLNYGSSCVASLQAASRVRLSFKELCRHFRKYSMFAISEK
jgi:hypothetical protein